jgi:hypothetical protein
VYNLAIAVIFLCICCAEENILLATRQEVAVRRLAFKQYMNELVDKRNFAPGQILPPLRELAEQHQLSQNVVRQVLREYIDSGLLHTISRVGTFIQEQRPQHIYESYLLLMPCHLPEDTPHWRMQTGFEERIAQLGGSSLMLITKDALRYRDQGELPAPAGVFEGAYGSHLAEIWRPGEITPHVSFNNRLLDDGYSDVVSFDDIDGGRQAAECLLALGHRQVVYLALHPQGKDPGEYLWSAQREEGWHQALARTGLGTADLAYHPKDLPDPQAKVSHHPEAPGDMEAIQIAAIRRPCDLIVRRPDITAVVAANDTAAIGLIEALREARTPPERWPAIVGFDNTAGAAKYLLTSLNLPWEELGRAAAELLWDRVHGRLAGPPVHRQIRMRLIRRMTSQAGWSVRIPAGLFSDRTKFEPSDDPQAVP